MFGFEMGLKPEDSMNAVRDQPKGRAFSEQAEIHEEASVVNLLRLADAFADVCVDTESGVEGLSSLFTAVLINAAAVVEFNGWLNRRCVTQRRVIALTAISVADPDRAQTLMLHRLVGNAAIGALCCSH